MKKKIGASVNLAQVMMKIACADTSNGKNAFVCVLTGKSALKSWMKKIFCIGFLCCLWGVEGYAQVKKIKDRSLVTDKEITITIAGDYKEEFKTRERTRYITIYRRDAKNLMNGVKCVDDITRYYGLEYVIVSTQGVNSNVSSSKFFFHNFWSGTKLFFRNGIGWKNRMRKKIDKCLERTGGKIETY